MTTARRTQCDVLYSNFGESEKRKQEVKTTFRHTWPSSIAAVSPLSSVMYIYIYVCAEITICSEIQ